MQGELFGCCETFDRHAETSATLFSSVLVKRVSITPMLNTALGKVVGRGYCEAGMQTYREAREVALYSRPEMVAHECLVSLVLGLNGHVYSLWVAATQRSCRRRHVFKKRVACSTKSSGYWWCAP